MQHLQHGEGSATKERVTVMKQFAIYEANMEGLLKKIKRIENKCKKFGCSFHFAEVGEMFKEVQDENGNLVTRRFILVEAEGIAVVNGWKFVASVEHTEKGNVFYKAVDVEIPARYYDSEPVCEHCNSRRARKNTFIIMNEETGEFKQVGHSCLKDFTNGMSAEGVAQYTSLFDELIKAEQPVGGSWGERYYKTEEILHYAAEVVRKFGYIKSQPGVRSTADLTIAYYKVNHGGLSLIEKKYEQQCKDEMESCGFNPNSAESVQLVKDALEWIKGQNEFNDYMHNLKTVCNLDHTTAGKCGILVSLFPAFNKDLERQAERNAKAEAWKKEQETSKHVGSIGERIEIQVASVQCVTSWETDWGITKIYKIIDVNGNVFTWKTGNFVEESKVQSIKGTVKDHKEFRGTKQTEITRCKVA